MNTLQDRVRAATHAIAGTVAPGSAPPLRLPAGPGRRGAPGRARRWAHGLTPAAAALAVAAVVLGSLALQRGGQDGLPVSPGPLPGGLPRYYAALVQEPSGPWWAEVRNTVTGRVLGTVRPPLPFTRFSEVAAAPDDHTFVLAGIGPQGQPSVTQLYALRLSPATGQVRLSRLPIPLIPERWRVNGLAVSPDGTRLAVTLEPPGGEHPRLRLYSMTSGALIREWGANTTHPDDALLFADMSWAPDGRTLEIGYPLHGNGVAMLDIIRPGTSLLASSRVVQFPTWADLTGYPTLTDGGRLLASAAYVTGRSEQNPWSAWLVAEFSTRTGKAVRVFTRQPLRAGSAASPATETGPAAVWWASPSGRVLIASPAAQGPGASQAWNGLGVFTGHRYIPLPWSRRIAEAAW